MKEQITELGSSSFIETDNLAIEHGPARIRQRELCAKSVERTERMAVTGNELTSTVVDDSERTEAIVLQFKDPFRMVEGRRSAGERHGLECHPSRIVLN